MSLCHDEAWGAEVRVEKEGIVPTVLAARVHEESTS
jgi:hypothetical protein